MILSRHPWDELFGGWGAQNPRAGLPYKRKDLFRPQRLTARDVSLLKRAPNSPTQKSRDAPSIPGAAAIPLDRERGTTTRASQGYTNQGPRMTFSYTEDRYTSQYTVRCDFRSVNICELSDSFKQENSVYPLARGARSILFPDAVRHLTQCNFAGWALAKLNPALQGKRNLIFSALENWLEDDPGKLSSQFGWFEEPKSSNLSCMKSATRGRREDQEVEGFGQPFVHRTDDGLNTTRKSPVLLKSWDGNTSNEQPDEGELDMEPQQSRKKTAPETWIQNSPEGKENKSRRAEIPVSPAEGATQQLAMEMEQSASPGPGGPDRANCDENIECAGVVTGTKDAVGRQEENELSPRDSQPLSQSPSRLESRFEDRGRHETDYNTDKEAGMGAAEQSSISPSTKIQRHIQNNMVLGQVMDFITSWLDSKIGTIVCRPRGVEGSTPSPVQGSTDREWDQSCRSRRQKQNHRIRKRPHLPDGEDSGNDTSEENDQGKNGWARRDYTTSRFACPFYKHDRRKYRVERSCCGPLGWPTVHRVKEHVYRRHALPKFRCNRCCENLKSSALLTAHQRSTNQCELRLDDSGDSVDEDTLAKLRSRKKGPEKTEEERWHAMYQLIFPDDSPVPTCFYDFTDCAPMKHDEADNLKQYGQYIRQQLPTLIRRELETSIDSEVLERLCSRLPALLQTLNQELHQAFQMSNGDSVGEITTSGQDSPEKRLGLAQASDDFNPVPSSEQLPRQFDPRLAITAPQTPAAGHSQPPLYLGDFSMPMESLGTDAWAGYDFSMPVHLGEDHAAQEKEPGCGCGPFEWTCAG